MDLMLLRSCFIGVPVYLAVRRSTCLHSTGLDCLLIAFGMPCMSGHVNMRPYSRARHSTSAAENICNCKAGSVEGFEVPRSSVRE